MRITTPIKRTLPCARLRRTVGFGNTCGLVLCLTTLDGASFANSEEKSAFKEDVHFDVQTTVNHVEIKKVKYF